jgi:hypothetical protein
MTTATAAAPAPAPDSAPDSFLARNRAAVLITAALLVAVVVAALTAQDDNATPMDPASAGPGGARAVAKVLDHEGVDVVAVRDAAELRAARVDDRTTVVVVLPDLLGEDTADDLLAHARGAAHVVVLGAGIGAAPLFGVGPVPSTDTLGKGRSAGCVDPLFDGLTVEVDSAYVYQGGDCFPGRFGALVVRPDERVLLFGADQAFTNDQVLRADNAAVALRLLGQDDRLVWYVPSPYDVGTGETVSLSSLLPRWINPALGTLFLVGVALVLWRSRRLGALATEPLPVVVRAVETTRSLGRLYRRAGDRAHAAAALRRSARAGCAERLRLGSRVDPAALVREVARRTGRPEDQVARLLNPPPGDPGPATDKDLITLAQDLAALDREVRDT